MTTSATSSLQRFGLPVLYLLGAWAALTVLLFAAPWTPAKTYAQSARYLLMTTAAIATAVCAFGAWTGLLRVMGMSVRPEAAPKPYQAEAKPLA